MKILKRIVPFVVILIALVLILAPLARRGFFVSDDGDWMIIRLSAFFQSLREGQFPVRFLGRLNHSYGYPVANFLYPGFLYIGSLLHILGFSFITSVKLILAGSVVGSAVFIYGWLRKYVRPWSASVGTVSFILLPYLGFDLYTRGSVGEVLALLGVAMCLYSVAHSKRSLFGASLALLILSHNSLALLFFVVLLVYQIYEKKFRLFIAPTVLGMGMAAFFWIPAIFERSYTLFDSVSVSDPGAFFLSFQALYLVASSLLFMVLAWFFGKGQPLVPLMLSASMLSIFLASTLSKGVWMWPLMHRIFQFPFRFLSILAVSIPFLTAILADRSPKRFRKYLICFMAIIWIVDLTHTLGTYRSTDHPETYYTTNEGTTTVADEYMPRWATLRPTERESQRIIFYKGKGSIEPNVFVGHAFRVTVVALEDSVLQVHTLYYPGWGAAVDGVQVIPDYSNLYGFMRIPLAAGSHTVEVAFRETPLRFAVDLLSLSSFILWIMYSLSISGNLVLFKRKKRTQP